MKEPSKASKKVVKIEDKGGKYSPPLVGSGSSELVVLLSRSADAASIAIVEVAPDVRPIARAR